MAVEGQPVTQDQSLAYLISRHPVGSRVRLDLIRDRQRRNVTVALGERPNEQALARQPG